MKRLLMGDQMKRCDSYTVNELGVTSRTLMQRAAEAAFKEIINGGFDISRVVCICGTGNNGGDGLALTTLLRNAGVNVEYFICGDKSRMTKECSFRYYALQAAGVTEQRMLDLQGVTLIVDAILGIGLNGDVRDGAAEVIDAVNFSGITVVSLDIPSGINSDTGAVMGRAVTASLTVAFARLKPGHIFYPGRTCCGRTVVAEIGIGEEGVEGESPVIYLAESCDIAEMMPERYPDSHKGTYGRLLVAAGSEGMCGAAYLSALGAYRSGVGLVEIFTPKVNVPILQGRLPEAIVCGWGAGNTALLRERMRTCDACVVGPGLGRDRDAVRITEEIMGSTLPLVIDADGLNIISESDDLKNMLKERSAPTVITPHPAEMSRLCGISVNEVCAEPIGTAADFAKSYGVLCVLKGATTVVASGDEVFLNATGCSGLAKGGSGDVLSGMIGAFLAAGNEAFNSAMSGVYLHGRAGEIAAGELSEYSLLASDIADNIGAAIKTVFGE